MKQLKFFIAFFFIIFSLEVKARWAIQEEMVYEVKKYNVDIDIKADGSSQEAIEVEELITKEAGRDRAAGYILSYNEGLGKIRIIEAYTIFNDIKYPIKNEMIEDKPIASTPQGFDQERQILISFPNAQVGSLIHLKYIQERKSPIENFFSSRRFYGFNEYWHSSKLTLHSELPLQLYINDPLKVLNINQSKKGNKYNITVVMTKPVCHTIMPGTENGIINPKYFTWFNISSAKNWSNLSKKLNSEYQTVLDQNLPKIFEEIAIAALKQSTEIDQINVVTKLLSDRVQYMGDWLSIKGKFFPRDLDKIANSQIGDCKDFSVSTAAILKKLGFMTNIALVTRGRQIMHFSDLPNLSDFNHAIVKVISKSGKIYWIDPTNQISMAQGIFSDIADRKALVLGLNSTVCENIPKIDPRHSQNKYIRKVKLTPSHELNIKGQYFLIGEEASSMTAIQLNTSEQAIKDYIYKSLNGTYLQNEHLKKKMILPDLTSKIVQDLTFEFEYESVDNLITTNLGKAILLPNKWSQIITNYARGQVSDLYLGTPVTIKNCFIIESNNIDSKKLRQSLFYNIKNKWLDISRTAKEDHDRIEINEEVVIKTDRIPNEDLQSKEFQVMYNELKHYFNGLAITLE